MRDKITKRKVNPLKLNSAGFSVEVSINWYEINAGFVSSNTAEAIVAGEGFDEAVEDDIGDHPTNGQALPESNFIKVGSQLADLKLSPEDLARIDVFNSGAMHEIGDETIAVFVINPTDESDEDYYSRAELDKFGFLRPSQISQVFSNADISETIVERFQSHKDRFRALNCQAENGGWLYVYSDFWKGCRLSTKPTEQSVDITTLKLVFFAVAPIIPLSDDLEDLIIPDSGLYLAAVVADDMIIPFLKEEDRDSGISRCVIEYRERDYPMLKYQS